MSETNETTPVATIPNLIVSPPTKLKVNNIEYDVCSVSFGTPPRHFEVRVLDEADQWDISEMAGADLSDNMPWMSRTMAAFAVVSIDGLPIISTRTRAEIRNVLRKLGRDGVPAAMQALAGMLRAETGAADPVDIAKNS